jgi:sulfur-carrier protein
MSKPTMDPTMASTSASQRGAPGTGARVTLRVPGPLRGLADGVGEVVLEAGTVGGAVDALLDRHPGLRRHLRTEAGSLREHVNLFRNQEDVRYAGGEAAALVDGDVVTIVPSIAGG